MMKHKQILVNLVELKLGDFEEIDLLVHVLDSKIIDLEAKDENKIFIALDRS